MSDIQHVPLNRLSVSGHNVRRSERKVEIDALAASIAAHGLLQNLTVTPASMDKFEVVAGARRLTALKLLAKSGAIAKDFAVRCHIVAAEAAAETSLAENVQRVAMSVMDEVEAFAGLIEGGSSADTVAVRFGCTLRHVEQRLALARLSPKIRAAYRRGDINLDAARAFCLTDDHAAQERVFKHLSKPITHAGSVRSALSQGRIPAHDRLARFVGLGAYEAAGGRLVRDLFDDGIVFLDDGYLLQRLAADKADALVAAARAEGWGWVEVQLGHGGVDGCAAERLRPGQRKLTRAELKALAALDAELRLLNEKLEDADDDSPLWAEQTAAEEKREALLDAAKVWDQALQIHAGALITIDRNGEPVIARGLIKRADLKTIDKIRRKAQTAPDGDSASPIVVDAVAAEGHDSTPRLPKALVEQLSAQRTCALRAHLAQSPGIALPVLVYVLLQQSAGLPPFAGIEIAARSSAFEDDEGFLTLRAALDTNVTLQTCLDASPDALLSQLAILTAETLNLSHAGLSPHDRRLQQCGDALAAALDLNMSAHWRPDADFFLRAPKALALAALQTAPAIKALPEDERAAMFAGLAKMKKAELAAVAADALRDGDWLPEPLITPSGAGAFALTAAGEAALAEPDAA